MYQFLKFEREAMKAYLILEDGSVYEGNNIGSNREVVSEIVFNTSMTGYLEVLTDPSYAGQGVVMTYPLIGNYGICYEDMESQGAWVDMFIVREFSQAASNFRNETSINEFLVQQNVPGISGIDTRDLTKRLREKGTMNGMLTTKKNFSLPQVLEKIKNYTVGEIVKKTSTNKAYTLKGLGKKVVLMDFGAKKSIAKGLNKRGCEVIVLPYDTKAEEVIAMKPDGIMLSNGPGDPKRNSDAIEQIKRLYDSDIPIFAICLGHQLMALATGANTYKLKYGHRGGNHPVKDLETGRTYITSQNHGYAVDENTLNRNICIPAFVNVNDNTNEGLKYLNKNIFTVQYHPEASPGPGDSSYLFDKFIKMMEV
mgnify:CR=1 FL=1